MRGRRRREEEAWLEEKAAAKDPSAQNSSDKSPFDKKSLEKNSTDPEQRTEPRTELRGAQRTLPSGHVVAFCLSSTSDSTVRQTMENIWKLAARAKCL